MAVTGAADPVGWIDGNPGQVFTQLQGVVITIAYCGIATFVVLKAIDLAIGLRVSEDVERDGLDLGLHGEAVP
jgi:Amt family ammonium transporter